MESKEIVAISCQQKRILNDIKKVKNRSRDVEDWLQESRQRTEAKRTMEYDQIQRRISRMKQEAGNWKPPGGASAAMTSHGHDNDFSGYDRFGHFQRVTDTNGQFGTMNNYGMETKTLKGNTTQNTSPSQMPKLPVIHEISNKSLWRERKSTDIRRHSQQRRSSEAPSVQDVRRSSVTSDISVDKMKPKRRFYLLGLTVGKLASKTSFLGGKNGRKLSLETNKSSSNSRRSSMEKPRRKSTDSSRRSSLEVIRNKFDKGTQRRRKRSLLPSDRRDINHMSTKGFRLFDYRAQLLNLGTQGDASSDSEDSLSSYEEL
ncbi:hypothetical protein BSL78_10613 [Apostichopus japonicus]|uniref:Uncharacterized protein n=1 Tax=Stichopus japonicus TaxID=307972 RepID=A0A2G8KX21_STIJA|nr:hypothetical protein BSL78_10613 [Apostichopus japonicus]